jgi:peptidoglycan/xylan/chitin deacetylase (PgdA/CDA1 family)
LKVRTLFVSILTLALGLSLSASLPPHCMGQGCGGWGSPVMVGEDFHCKLAVDEQGKVLRAGESFQVPVLLYHHITPEKQFSKYYLSKEAFAAQMDYLDQLGYTTLTMRQLALAIHNCTPLPQRPIVITFDDGNGDIYQYAFPIMQQHGFVGVMYLIGDYLNGEGLLNIAQVRELARSGWEIGSHSQSHVDLRYVGKKVKDEVLLSRKGLIEKLGLTVDSFAYPYGMTTRNVTRFVQEAGYLSGVGLGVTDVHTADNLYYLSRQEITGWMTFSEFARLLPFH